MESTNLGNSARSGVSLMKQKRGLVEDEFAIIEKPKVKKLHWLIRQYVGDSFNELEIDSSLFAEFHLPPEIFVSDGTPDSIVGKWVDRRDGVGGIHHLAYQVESVEKTMKECNEKGYAEFASEAPLTCPGLIQVFTKPSELTGVIY